MRLKLTDLAIQKLKPRPTGQYTVFEGDGFGIRVSQRSKSFVVMYGNRRQLKTLGRYPAQTLKDARREAQAFLATFSPHARETPTVSFAEGVERFLEESRVRHKPQTTKDYARNLAFYCFEKPIKEITRAEILDRLKILANHPVTQNHTFDTAVNFFNWCLRNDLLDRHPLQGERKPSPKRHRERVLTEDELRAVYRRAETFPFPYGHIVRLLALTGQRRGEILHLTWDRVGDTLQFLDTKNRTDHEIPLLPMAREVIKSIFHRKTYLFENTKPKLPTPSTGNGSSETPKTSRLTNTGSGIGAGSGTSAAEFSPTSWYISSTSRQIRYFPLPPQ